MNSSLAGATANIIWEEESEGVVRSTWNVDDWQCPLGKCSKHEDESSSLHVIVFDELKAVAAA